MGSKRYFENTCDACGATATVGTGDFRLGYKKPEDPDQLAAWIEWNNWPGHLEVVAEVEAWLAKQRAWIEVAVAEIEGEQN